MVCGVILVKWIYSNKGTTTFDGVGDRQHILLFCETIYQPCDSY